MGEEGPVVTIDPAGIAALQSQFGLTDKQAAFCMEYLVDLNATKAYSRAGYQVSSSNVASANASRLMKRPHVRSAIEQLKAERAARLQVDQDYVITKLQDLIDVAMQKVEIVGKNGTGRGIYRHVDAAAARSSLELLGKHQGMFKEQVHHTGDLQPTLLVKIEPPTPKEIIDVDHRALPAAEAG